jgi:hypothetical protein
MPSKRLYSGPTSCAGALKHGARVLHAIGSERTTPRSLLIDFLPPKVLKDGETTTITQTRSGLIIRRTHPAPRDTSTSHTGLSSQILANRTPTNPFAPSPVPSWLADSTSSSQRTQSGKPQQPHSTTDESSTPCDINFLFGPYMNEEHRQRELDKVEVNQELFNDWTRTYPLWWGADTNSEIWPLEEINAFIDRHFDPSTGKPKPGRTFTRGTVYAFGKPYEIIPAKSYPPQAFEEWRKMEHSEPLPS